MSLLRVRIFKSSILHGGLPFMPDIIEIDDTYVTIKRRRTPLSAIHTVSIPLRNIVTIKIFKSGLRKKIFIESLSKSSILGQGFSGSNLMKIKSLISENSN